MLMSDENLKDEDLFSLQKSIEFQNYEWKKVN